MVYRMALNFRGAQFTLFFANLGKQRNLCTTKIFSKLLLVALGRFCQAFVCRNPVSTANSDVAKVLELKDSIRSEGHTRNCKKNIS